MTDSSTPAQTLVDELAAQWLADAPAESLAAARAGLQTLVTDWQREAQGADAPAAIVAARRAAVQHLLDSRPQPTWPDALRAEELRILVQSLSKRTWALATSILDGTTERSAALDRGQALLAEATTLGPRVQALVDRDLARPIQLELGEAMMEALYVVEGKAMSLRLGRYRPAR